MHSILHVNILTEYTLETKGTLQVFWSASPLNEWTKKNFARLRPRWCKRKFIAGGLLCRAEGENVTPRRIFPKDYRFENR
jgi:hypothetical protein